jgi:prolyl-tRNA editing enzyme YbaK/EbsC (Cys-tRNA(Pro) deacylase)
MNGILEESSVKRVLAALNNYKFKGQVRVLTDTAKEASEAAAGLGIEVGQIASSLIF